MNGKGIVLCYMAVMNLYTFFLYGQDKKRAVKNIWRIPEWKLLTAAWAGGALGALIGMRFFHHKTRRGKFRIMVPAALILWGIVIFACIVQ